MKLPKFKESEDVRFFVKTPQKVEINLQTDHTLLYIIPEKHARNLPNESGLVIQLQPEDFDEASQTISD